MFESNIIILDSERNKKSIQEKEPELLQSYPY